MNISEIINELGEDRSQYFNAVSPPIMQASNFAFPNVAALSNAFADEMGDYIYSRGNNPTVHILRKKLAALDGAEDSLIFNNGAAATFAAVMAHVKAGDHVVCVQQPYSWTQKLFDILLAKFGVQTSFIDGRYLANWEAATQPNTVLYYLESPNSWTYELQPIAEVAALAKSKNIVTILDNTYCTPIYQNVIHLGIDMAMQTCTKYIGGHSDTLGGVISGSRKIIRKIFENEYLTSGNGATPFNAWLLLRGLRTLPLRLERVNATTARVLDFLGSHPGVEKILFPFHPSFPQYDLARLQMKAALGLMTIVLKNRERQAIIQFCEGLEHFLLAVSWGGHESLVLPRCATLSANDYNGHQEWHRHIRLYIGLEEPEGLIKDLEQALERIGLP